MRRPGSRRAALDATLSAAYRQGLLSDDTFAARLEQLLGRGPVHPDRLVGDVTLRGRPLGRATPAAAVGRLLRWPETARARRHAPLLSLDWTGATEALLVGRAEHCDVVLDDPRVSRRHARLVFSDGAWIVKDLGSRNGTTLNGATVQRSRLRPGDLIAFADLRLRVD